MYTTLNLIHITCAIVTICGFMVRGYWMMTGSALLGYRITRIAPHVIDTLFLASGIALIFELGLQLMQSGWLLAKFIGLIAYIVLGAIALRRGPTAQVRLIAFVGALSVYAYIIGVAMSKSPLSWLTYVTM